MPRTATQFQTIREESKARILEAALQTFNEAGYDGASVRMIAQQAGISQGLLYNYFAGKDELLRELFEHSMRDVRESFGDASDAGTPQERLAQIVRRSIAIIRRNQTFWRLSYGVRMQPAVLAKLGGALTEWIAMIRAVLEEQFRAAGSPTPEIDAELMFAAIDGMCQHYVLQPDTYPFEQVGEALISRFIK